MDGSIRRSSSYCTGGSIIVQLGVELIFNMRNESNSRFQVLRASVVIKATTLQVHHVAGSPCC